MDLERDDFAVIKSLDFEQIKAKLMHEKAGKGWSKARVEAAEREYRRFLYLMKKYPNELTAPSMEVDTFWHQHILDTVKYARDCQAVFGYFLHHNPYLGLGEVSDDDALRHRAGKRMQELYEEAFGEAAPGAKTAWCTLSKALQGQAAETAWCTLTAEPGAQPQHTETAWCTVTATSAAPSPSAETAWCTVTATSTAPASSTETAWCTVTTEPRMRARPAETAWCTVTADTEERTQGTETAWCTVPPEPAIRRVTHHATAGQVSKPARNQGEPVSHRAEALH
jgi:hypothetical protein